MFYSDVILSKRGPLGNIWLAAHMERRLTKAVLLKTSVGKSVEAIMGQSGAPMALRLTGQLLLGVVRIYSRKTKYLLDDCNDALLKIKVAFRSGAVDMTTDNLNASRNAITLQPTMTEFDMYAPDVGLEDWDLETGRGGTPRPHGSKRPGSGAQSGSTHLARAQDITLPRLLDESYEDDAAWDMTQTGIASADFEDGGLDLGLELDDDEAERRGFGEGPGAADDSLSVGIGRDAAGSEVGARSVGSLLGLGAEGDETLGVGRDSLGPLPDYDDGGFDFLDGGDSLARGSEAPAITDDTVDMTPRTAAKIREAAERRLAEEAKLAGKGAGKRQIVDARIELAEAAPGSQSLAHLNTAALGPESYLPKSRVYLQLLAMQADPSKLFPFSSLSDKLGSASLFAGPQGLAPQLTSLFTFDTNALRRRRQAESAALGEPGAKRMRTEELSEIGRREASNFDQQSGFLDLGGDDTYGQEGLDLMMDDAGMPDVLPEAGGEFAEEAGLRRSMRKSKAEAGATEETITGRLAPLSRLATPEGDEGLEEDEGVIGYSPSSSNPLAAFDARPADAEKQAAVQSGLTNNTIRALRVMRSELGERREAEAKGKEISFDSVSQGASRRAAAGFFFELLVLATKDAVALDQPEPYGDISVAPKDGLWDLPAGPATRRSVVAPAM
ncbi:hypothetical protein IE81DRAFT_369597 [Ceraceosorus guamensis]|uniref:Rad21/Rec8-like protein N-terminal domain-containing protein n=1 Tax=Ceraceosorus guamensis TaxID=1522189 RepID=A0A316VQU9_9BASI|nr:hypothetical protein IE81DRAFT_369597 [Ceraceosorus guamensis]PWN38773.1 hypothetical protein IE81DRAFT_369597 [Ceraceosorus guamensis]